MKFESPQNMGQEKSPLSEQEDLNNLEVSTRIFESGTPEELSCLKTFFNLTDNQMDLFSHYIKLRKKTVEACWASVEAREVENPQATEVEVSMGAYVENIEPQVRGAVLSLREKGYATYESGFYGENVQLISFEEDQVVDYSPSDVLRDFLEEQGVVISVEPNSVGLSFDKKLSLQEIKGVWEKVSGDLPDLGQPVGSCELQAAVMFREKQKELK